MEIKLQNKKLNVRNFTHKLNQFIEDVFHKVGEAIVKEAKNNAPERKATDGSYLSQNIKLEEGTSSGAKRTFRIVADHPSAMSAHEMPFKRGALTQDEMIRNSLSVSGGVGNKYIERAANTAAPEIEQFIRAAVEDFVEGKAVAGRRRRTKIVALFKGELK